MEDQLKNEVKTSASSSDIGASPLGSKTSKNYHYKHCNCITFKNPKKNEHN